MSQILLSESCTSETEITSPSESCKEVHMLPSKSHVRKKVFRSAKQHEQLYMCSSENPKYFDQTAKELDTVMAKVNVSN